MPTPTRSLKVQIDTYVGHLADLEYARTTDEAAAVWSAADRDREIDLLTVAQHRVIAGRAEELIAALPAPIRILPAQRSSEVRSR